MGSRKDTNFMKQTKKNEKEVLMLGTSSGDELQTSSQGAVAVKGNTVGVNCSILLLR